MPRYHIDDLNHILADKLKNKRRNPQFLAEKEGLEILLAHKPVVMSGEAACQNDPRRVAERIYRMPIWLCRIDATRNNKTFPSNAHWPDDILARMKRSVWNNIQRRVKIVTQRTRKRGAEP